MSHINEIKALYDRGDYQQAREMCLEGIYECQEYAFLHSGTELENAREAELNAYIALKDRVTFPEMRDYFSRKTHKGWNADMTARLNHFIELVKITLSGDSQALQQHQKTAPNSMFFSEYKRLIQTLDTENIKAKSSEVLNWLKSLPVANPSLERIQTALTNSFHQAQTPMADILQGKEPIQLPLFPSQNP
ncbi:MAG: hypothetical protein K0Q57_281 [Gammaproteobacteria bacterium]|jgi:hypothetical protein|nr:hypothetical protein [Gammaproteobacteria bacterium]